MLFSTFIDAFLQQALFPASFLRERNWGTETNDCWLSANAKRHVQVSDTQLPLPSHEKPQGDLPLENAGHVWSTLTYSDGLGRAFVFIVRLAGDHFEDPWN